jgi:hypothetical protein
MVNKIFKTGTYKINVGSGGAGAGGSVNGSFNGNNSSITEVNNANKFISEKREYRKLRVGKFIVN